MCEKIDFVITWLDGNDSKWIAQKNEALQNLQPWQKLGNDATESCRFRDMGLLRYWFRAVEKNAPWVNKIYFVTCGQKPEWMNEKHPKLVLVNHEDFIPSKYLPTFNSNTIEINLHRIPSLSEHFVLFNDDVFLLKPVLPDMFFKKGYPVLPCNLYICRTYGNNNWSKVNFNNNCTVHEHFNINKSIWNNRKKWFSISKLGAKLAVMNLIRYFVNRTYLGGQYEHLANPHLKSTMQEVWNECSDIMEATSASRFRSDVQINQWLMLTWNMAKGCFYPIRAGKRGKNINVCNDNSDNICDIIKRQSFTQICINDTVDNDKPELCFNAIGRAFDMIYPNKSDFEK